MIPILEEYNKKTSQEIKKEIEGKKKINVNYYPIMAKRAQEDSFFKDFLIKEIDSKENLEEKFFGIVKVAWIPLISIIENSNHQLIEQAIKVFKNWPQKEKENLISYLHENEIVKYFI